MVPVTTFLREFAEWGGVIFVLAVIGTVAYVWRVRTEPDEQIATVGGRFWRAALGVVLTGTALLAPLYQAHLHTDISFQKHIGFGLFFAAPMAGLGLARILGDHLPPPARRRRGLEPGPRARPDLVQRVTVPGVAGLRAVRADLLHVPQAECAGTWSRCPRSPSTTWRTIRTRSPGSSYSTFYLSYPNKKGVTQTGPAGYASALKAGYFQMVAYYVEVTPACGRRPRAQALATSRSYYLAAEDQHHRLVRRR